MAANYSDFQVLQGPETIGRRLGFAGASLEGITSTLESRGIEVVPTIAADAVPGGIASRPAYERIKKNLLTEIRRASRIDGVCLGLHGSMWVERIGHGDGDLLAAVRRLLGPTIPIVAALDMHATLTPTLISNLDGLTLYRTAPHADIFQTGERAANLLVGILEERLKPAVAYTKLPLILTGEQSMTAYEPMVSLMRMLDETDAKPNVLSSSIAIGMFWIDAYESGAATVVTTDGDKELAKAEADRLATALWSRRKEFKLRVEAYPIDDAIERALEDSRRPVFLSDTGDDTTAGATGDVPLIVERLLAKHAKDAVVAAVYDPRAVKACTNAGVGQQLTVRIGGRLDVRGGQPLRVKGRVRLLSDGRYYREGARDQPQMLDEMGRTAVLELDGVDVVLSERRIAIVEPAQLRSLGIEPTERKIIVVKTGYLWPALQAMASRVIFMLSPGSSDCDFTRMGFRNLRRPIYPFDIDTKWPEA